LAFRFGELGERSLHKALKAYFCPPDGQDEVPFKGAIADLWSPTQGIIEIQTRSLSKLQTKVRRYLDEGLKVTIVFPIAEQRVIVRWNAERSVCLSRRRSPKKGRLEASFREIGSLSTLLLEPGLCLKIVGIDEEEHRCQDGQGGWRLAGQSRIDRVLVQVNTVKTLETKEDFRALVPSSWVPPATATDLAHCLNQTLRETQPLVSCLKKLKLLQFCGKRGRSELLCFP